MTRVYNIDAKIEEVDGEDFFGAADAFFKIQNVNSTAFRLASLDRPNGNLIYIPDHPVACLAKPMRYLISGILGARIGGSLGS